MNYWHNTTIRNGGNAAPVLAQEREESTEPKPDIACCSSCGWRGPTATCQTESEGSWETGYYQVHVCPVCEDGGCVDDYDMSPEQLAKWNAWSNKKIDQIL